MNHPTDKEYIWDKFSMVQANYYFVYITVTALQNMDFSK